MTSNPGANKQSYRQRPTRPAGLRNGVKPRGEVEKQCSAVIKQTESKVPAPSTPYSPHLPFFFNSELSLRTIAPAPPAPPHNCARALNCEVPVKCEGPGAKSAPAPLILLVLAWALCNFPSFTPSAPFPRTFKFSSENKAPNLGCDVTWKRNANVTTTTSVVRLLV